jgi:hypothetical protein
VWATRISFLDVLSAALLSFRMPGNLNPRKGGTARSLTFEWLKYSNLVPRACDPWEGNEGSGIIRCRKPGILAKIEQRIHFNGQSDSSLKQIIPEPSFPSQRSQARGTRLEIQLNVRPNLRPNPRLPSQSSLLSRRILNVGNSNIILLCFFH